MMRKLLAGLLLAIAAPSIASAQTPRELDLFNVFVHGAEGAGISSTDGLVGPVVQKIWLSGDTVIVAFQPDSATWDPVNFTYPQDTLRFEIGATGGVADGVVTGGSFDQTSQMLTLARSVGTSLMIDLGALLVASEVPAIVVAGATDGQCLVRSGLTIASQPCAAGITLAQLADTATAIRSAIPAPDGVVESATLSGQVLSFSRTVLGPLTVNLSTFTTATEATNQANAAIAATVPGQVSDSLDALRSGLPPRQYFTAQSVAGSTSNILLTTGENLTALQTGMYFYFRADRTSGANLTINVDGTGSRFVRRANSTFGDENVPAGQFQNGTPVLVWYDGTDDVFHLAGLRVGDASFRNVGVAQGNVPVLGVGDVLPASVIPPGVGGGINIVFADGVPDAATGSNNDWGIDESSGAWYQKVANVWTLRYPGAIERADANGVLADATLDDFGRIAIDGTNLRVARIDPNHENPPTATFAEYSAAGFRGVHVLCPDITDPVLNDRCFSTLNRIWYRYGGSSWSSLSAAPSGWRGAYGSEQEALVHLRAVNDVVWWTGSTLMHRVATFTAGSPIYEWAIPSEIAEALHRDPFDGLSEFTDAPQEDDRLIVRDELTGATGFREFEAIQNAIRPTISNQDGSVEVLSANRFVFQGNGVTVAASGRTATMTITGGTGGGGTTVVANPDGTTGDDLDRIEIGGVDYNIARADPSQIVERSSLPDATTDHAPVIVYLTHGYGEGNRQDAQLVMVPEADSVVQSYSDGTIAGPQGYVSQRSPANRIVGVHTRGATDTTYSIESIQSTDRLWLEAQTRMLVEDVFYTLGDLLEEGHNPEIYAKRVLAGPQAITEDTLDINFQAGTAWWYTDASSVRYDPGLYELVDTIYHQLTYEGLEHVDGVAAPQDPPVRAAQAYINDEGRVWIAGDEVTINTTANSIQRNAITTTYFVEDAPNFTTLLNNGDGSFSREADGTFAQIQGTQGVQGITWRQVWRYIVDNVADNIQTQSFLNSTWLGSFTNNSRVADALAVELLESEVFARFDWYFGIIGDLDVYEITNFTRGTTTRSDVFHWTQQATIGDVSEAIEAQAVRHFDGVGRPDFEPDNPGQFAVNDLGWTFVSTNLLVTDTGNATWLADSISTVPENTAPWDKWRGALDRPGVIDAADECAFEYSSHGSGFWEWRQGGSYMTGRWSGVLACFAQSPADTVGSPANLVHGTTASVFLDAPHHSFENEDDAAAFLQTMNLAPAVTSTTPYVYLHGTHGQPGQWELRLVQPGGFTPGLPIYREDEPYWNAPLAFDRGGLLVVEITQTEYDALTPKDQSTLYVIVP